MCDSSMVSPHLSPQTFCFLGQPQKAGLPAGRGRPRGLLLGEGL